jgi:hypothetical protein
LKDTGVYIAPSYVCAQPRGQRPAEGEADDQVGEEEQGVRDEGFEEAA